MSEQSLGAKKVAQKGASDDAGASISEMKMPSAAGASMKGTLPAAKDVALEDILPVNPRLFSEHRWHEYFARLREEDPVHFNETDVAGRFWSLTRYEDIKKVDTDWKNFSSANGITLGFPVGA